MGQKALFFVDLIISPNIKRFLKFFSLLESGDNLEWNYHYRSHHTSSVSLHYLVKCLCLKSNNWKQDDFCNNIF